MKKTTSILCLLLAGALLLAGCDQEHFPENGTSGRTTEGESTVTADPSDSTDSTDDPDLTEEEIIYDTPIQYAATKFDPDAPHGKKAAYGGVFEGGTIPYRTTLDQWGDSFFGLDSGAFLVRYDRTGQDVPTVVCPDPLCPHNVDTCPAFYQFDYYTVGSLTSTRIYPRFIFCDYYDNADSPVFYSVYRRSTIGHLAGKSFRQVAYYQIQRYDVSGGERETLCAGIQDLIHSVYTYGDYLYYTASENYHRKFGIDQSEATYTLRAIPKTGGEPITLPGDRPQMLEILDITDDGVYYLVDSRYVYRCSPTLENPELLLDLDSVKDENGGKMQAASARGGFLFCFGDLALVDPPTFDGLYEGSCYRLSLSDPSEPAVKIAEHLLCATSFLVFTENYLYYMPDVMEYVGGNKVLYPYNYSNGTVKAVNLFTGETVTCCEDTGVSFFAGYDLGDDTITVYGQAYEAKGLALGDNKKYTRIYPDGRSAELWIDEKTARQGFVIPG